MKRAKFRREAKFYGAVGLIAVCAFVATMVVTRGEGQPAQAMSRTYDFGCDVRYVTDGDTLRCMDGTRVRLHAISARESDGTCSPGHPCSSASAEVSKAALVRLAGSHIECIRTGSSYNRVTAICDNAAGVEINCAMVQSGAAVVWDRFNRERAICRP